MTEDYVNFETAKLLKEKGFDIPCDYAYNNKAGYFEVDRSNFDEVYCFRPSLAMAMKWLREVHQIFIRPNTSFLYPIKWYSEIFCYGDNLKTQQDVKTEYYDSPEESCEAAIKYVLENLI